MRSIVVAILLVAPLAGCFTEEEPVVEAAAPEQILVTQENDLASLANGSFMMAEHKHDYWGGKDRLLVIDEARDEGTTWFGGVWAFHFVPADGIVVPQGTAAVEVTITWIDEPDHRPIRYSTPELAIKTAVDDTPVVVGPVTSGMMVRVPVAPEQADLPHQSISAWQFSWRLHPGLLPVEGTPGVLWRGNVSVKVEAILGHEIPVYPPHPDLWGGKETMPLFQTTRGPALWWGSPDDWGCIRACPVRLSPENGTVVPFDAATVRVVLEAHPDVTGDIGLLYHGGLTREWQELTPTAIDGRVKTYEIPVAVGEGDSPYASQSVWEFAVFVAAPERDFVMTGTYSITAEALKGAGPA